MIADVWKLLDVANTDKYIYIYAHLGTPRKVPHQAWYCLCWDGTPMGFHICETDCRFATPSGWGDTLTVMLPLGLLTWGLDDLELLSSFCDKYQVEPHMICTYWKAQKYHTKRGTCCAWGGTPRGSIYLWNTLELCNISNVVNIYGRSGRPRKVPHQAWYFLCLGWIALWVYTFVKSSQICETSEMLRTFIHISEGPEKYHTKRGTFWV